METILSPEEQDFFQLLNSKLGNPNSRPPINLVVENVISIKNDTSVSHLKEIASSYLAGIATGLQQITSDIRRKVSTAEKDAIQLIHKDEVESFKHELKRS
jgi:hypothetical protein